MIVLNSRYAYLRKSLYQRHVAHLAHTLNISDRAYVNPFMCGQYICGLTNMVYLELVFVYNDFSKNRDRNQYLSLL